MPIGPILILEDDKDDQEVFKEVIESLDGKHEVIMFDSGFALIQYLRTTTVQPFLIFSDINMPIISGIEVRNLINQDEALRKKSIPFIFLSTSDNAALVEQAYDLAVQGFFTKRHTYQEIAQQFSAIFNFWRECKHPNN